MEPTRTELRWALKVAMTEGNGEDRRQATAALADHQARATAVAVEYGRGMNDLRHAVLGKRLGR